MNDKPKREKPSLKKFSADIKFTTNTGARLECGYHSRIATPQKALVSAFEEMARVGAIAGWQTELRDAMEGAFKRVAEYEAEQQCES